MRYLGWNCRGLSSGDSPSVPYVAWLVRKFSSSVVFLSETKLLSSSLGFFANTWNFDDYFGVDALGS